MEPQPIKLNTIPTLPVFSEKNRLEEELQSHKLLWSQAKSLGDTVKSKEELLVIKNIKDKISKLESSRGDEDVPQPPQQRNIVNNNTKTVPTKTIHSAPDLVSPAAKAKMELAKKQEKIVEGRYQEYLKASSQVIKNTPDHSDLMMKAKLLSHSLLLVRSGEPIDLQDLPPSPLLSSVTIGDIDEEEESANQSPVHRKFDPEEQERIITFETLQQHINQQVQRLHTHAHEAKEIGDKQLAIKYLRERDDFVSYRETVTRIQAAGGPPPLYHFETRSFTQEVRFPNLSDNMLEIHVVRALNLLPPAGVLSLDSYIIIQVQLLPTDPIQKINTPTIKGSFNPEYNHKAQVLIERKKSVVKAIERKRLIVEVYQPKLWGLLKFADTPIARGEIKLSDLANKSEVSLTVPLVSSGGTGVAARRHNSTNSSVEVVLRLSRPLVAAADFKVVTEPYLIMDLPSPAPPTTTTAPNTAPNIRGSSNNNTSTSTIPSISHSTSAPGTGPGLLRSSAAKATPATGPGTGRPTGKTSGSGPAPGSGAGGLTASASAAGRVSAETPKRKTSASPLPSPAAPQPQLSTLSTTPSATPSLSGSGAVTGTNVSNATVGSSAPKPQVPIPTPTPKNEDEDLEDYNSIDDMISNDVLEWELGNVTKQIAQAKAARQDTADLEFRKQMVDSKLNILTIMVQTGKLTYEQYCCDLEEKIKVERDRARTYMQAKNKPAAAFALRRAKIMENELSQQPPAE
eukprot:TRINITY_DN8056_c0_g1_i1.p1 TRINITY_DN8056_c0_g1~~TRINITY_DN8056_c0_g1_i1.p1  ORF type:complete len:824 (+),score=194.49 TRINITY_DN8056_c0_g1_i1:254-2473(+)